MATAAPRKRLTPLDPKQYQMHVETPGHLYAFIHVDVRFDDEMGGVEESTGFMVDFVTFENYVKHHGEDFVAIRDQLFNLALNGICIRRIHGKSFSPTTFDATVEADIDSETRGGDIQLFVVIGFDSAEDLFDMQHLDFVPLYGQYLDEIKKRTKLIGLDTNACSHIRYSADEEPPVLVAPML